MKNKLFAAAITMSLLTPGIVQPVEASSVKEVVFSDVKKNNSELSYSIYELSKIGVIKGFPNGTFGGNQTVNRGQVASMISRALNLKTEGEVKGFSDVLKNNSHKSAIEAVQSAGLMSGYEDGTFRPSDPLSRAQLAKVLSLAFELPEVKDMSVFSDVKSSHWANAFINSLAAKEISIGSEGKFRPNESVTRGQYALFLHRALNWAQVENKDVIKDGVVVTPSPKPEPKPEPKPDDNTKILLGENVKKPSGWTQKVVEQHKNKFAELRPLIHGSGGTGAVNLRTQAHVDYYTGAVPKIVESFNKRGASTSVEEYIAAINEVMRNGTVYVHPSKMYSMYFDYDTNMLNFLHMSVK